MLNINTSKYNCCGCSACMNICPQHAISMVEDEEGFLYPEVDKKRCSKCNLCESVCIFNKKEKAIEGDKPLTYGVIHKDNDIRCNSRSGGMFTAISDYILNKNGVVYGVGYKDHLKVCHKRALNKQERDEFRGSKYVQSELGNIFEFIKEDLKNNKYVLFSGTPCQVDSLYSYLLCSRSIDIDKLITCDLICHGVPSPLIWREYLKFQENRYKGKIKSFDFRNKQIYGWEEHIESFSIGGKIHSSRIFTKLFYDHRILRPSCYKCPYTSIYRNADITLGDFWGIEKNNTILNDNKGVSLILLNTEKGRKAFNNIKEQLNYTLCKIENCMQPSLYKNIDENNQRKIFWQDYYVYGFEYILKKYIRYGNLFNIKENIRLIIRKYEFNKRISKN